MANKRYEFNVVSSLMPDFFRKLGRFGVRFTVKKECYFMEERYTIHGLKSPRPVYYTPVVVYGNKWFISEEDTIVSQLMAYCLS